MLESRRPAPIATGAAAAASGVAATDHDASAPQRASIQALGVGDVNPSTQAAQATARNDTTSDAVSVHHHVDEGTEEYDLSNLLVDTTSVPRGHIGGGGDGFGDSQQQAEAAAVLGASTPLGYAVSPQHHANHHASTLLSFVEEDGTTFYYEEADAHLFAPPPLTRPTLSTFPNDVLGHVMSYLTLADVALHLRFVNQKLCGEATAVLEERYGYGGGGSGGVPRCFLHPSRISRVELAMPAVVKAITFDAVTHRLYVCTLGDCETECVLYEHLPIETADVLAPQSWVFTEQHKGRLMQRIALHPSYGDDGGGDDGRMGSARRAANEYAIQFEGPFLVCTSPSGNDACVVFDCRNRVHLELPMGGYSGLFASITGRRMAATTMDDELVVFLSPLFGEGGVGVGVGEAAHDGAAALDGNNKTNGMGDGTGVPSSLSLNSYENYRARSSNGGGSSGGPRRRRRQQHGNIPTSPTYGYAGSSVGRSGGGAYPPSSNGSDGQRGERYHHDADDDDDRYDDDYMYGDDEEEDDPALPITLIPSFRTRLLHAVKHVITDTYIVSLHKEAVSGGEGGSGSRSASSGPVAGGGGGDGDGSSGAPLSSTSLSASHFSLSAVPQWKLKWINCNIVEASLASPPATMTAAAGGGTNHTATTAPANPSAMQIHECVLSCNTNTTTAAAVCIGPNDRMGAMHALGHDGGDAVVLVEAFFRYIVICDLKVVPPSSAATAPHHHHHHRPIRIIPCTMRIPSSGPPISASSPSLSLAALGGGGGGGSSSPSSLGSASAAGSLRCMAAYPMCPAAAAVVGTSGGGAAHSSMFGYHRATPLLLPAKGGLHPHHGGDGNSGGSVGGSGNVIMAHLLSPLQQSLSAASAASTSFLLPPSPNSPLSVTSTAARQSFSTPPPPPPLLGGAAAVLGVGGAALLDVDACSTVSTRASTTTTRRSLLSLRRHQAIARRRREQRGLAAAEEEEGAFAAGSTSASAILHGGSGHNNNASVTSLRSSAPSYMPFLRGGGGSAMANIPMRTAPPRRDPIHGALCCVGMVGHDQYQLVLLSLDGSLIRRLNSPHSGMVAPHPLEPMLVAANDDGEGLSENLLLQALEGGFGSLIQFEPMDSTGRPSSILTRTLDAFLFYFSTFLSYFRALFAPETWSWLTSLSLRFIDYLLSFTVFSMDNSSLVIILCYAAILMSLAATTFLLIYNGWWLYMQRLVSVFGYLEGEEGGSTAAASGGEANGAAEFMG